MTSPDPDEDGHRSRPVRRPPPTTRDTPGHPPLKAGLLMVFVVLVIIALAASGLVFD